MQLGSRLIDESHEIPDGKLAAIRGPLNWTAQMSRMFSQSPDFFCNHCVFEWTSNV